jgi:enoyl-CoA hydratase
VIEVVDRGEVRWIWLDRARARNAQDVALLQELERVLLDTAGTPSVRVVVLAGRGPSFSSGHDIKQVVTDREYRERISTVEGRLWLELELFVRPVELLRSLRVPTVCRVQGHCVAAAIMLADACDLVVAADDARFYSRVTRDMGADDVEIPALGWALGARRAKQLQWLGEELDAHAAERLGLVNWVVPLDELDAKVEDVAVRLLEVPREALALSKRSLRFMEDRRGRSDSAAYHFLSHQVSHATSDAVALLEQRIADLESKDRP